MNFTMPPMMTFARLGVTAILLLLVCPLAINFSIAEYRIGGEYLPEWEVNQYWEYRGATVELSSRVLFTEIGTIGTCTIKFDMVLTPASIGNQSKYTVTDIDTQRSEYKLAEQDNGWENGTYALIVVNNGGCPQYPVGTVFSSGSYQSTSSMNGEGYYDIQNINYKGGNYTSNWNIDAGTGVDAWQFAEKEDIQETSNDEKVMFKPDWDQAPMKPGDSWAQTNRFTRVTRYDFSYSGSITNGGKGMKTENKYYNLIWTVASKASKTISSTKKGSTNFSDALKIIRDGSYQWETTDGSYTTSGTTTSGPYEVWYAGDGDNFDAGWAIEFNATTHIIYSSYVAFINTRPTFTSPPQDTTINSDEVWNFKNTIDYAVSDPDPGNAGQLGYTIKKALGTNTNVLKNLTIDPDTGDITFTPNQKDVADGYQITINATDRYEKGPLGTEATFTLNITNKNHSPTVNTNIVQNFIMKEGETSTPAWKLSDAFHDPDMDANPLMGNAPYDPAEKLTYSVGNNGSVRVLCKGTDITAFNNCADISFAAIDGKFPRDMPVAMTITATDRSGQKVSDQVTGTVQHMNHGPRAIKNNIPIEMMANSPMTTELKTYFKDQDINVDSSYVTGDTWSFDHEGNVYIKVDITGSKAKLTPAVDWCGKEEITFTATDKGGASAHIILMVDVTGCETGITIESVNPTTDPTIFETIDGTDSGKPGTQKFSIMAHEGNDNLSYNWTVEGDAQNVYNVDTHTNAYVFTTNFDCDFENGKFCGGDSSKTYYVTVYVTDGVLDVEGKKWYMTINNVNRRPIIEGVIVTLVPEKGHNVQLPFTNYGNYSLEYGKTYDLDSSTLIKDMDQQIGPGLPGSLDGLTIEWKSSDGKVALGPTIRVGAGTSKPVTMKLIPDEVNHITLKVTDRQGGSTDYDLTLVVGKAPPTKIIKLDLHLAIVSVIVAAVIVFFLKQKATRTRNRPKT